MSPVTQANTQAPVRKIIWTNILFFAAATLLGLVGAPLYFLRQGISISETLLFGFYLIATSLSITMGYHRLFAHRSYKANPVVEFLLLFFGAAAFEQSALKWASQHRTHHQFVDTSLDPYSIKKGFFYAHIGWLIFWKHPADYRNVPDLTQKKWIMHQHRYFLLWSAVSGIALPVVIGAFSGHALGALLFAVGLRLTLVYHATFCINSVCHLFGRATYDIYSSAKDHWLVALLTFGEGYHNFHHHFPSDYRNGVRWHHWDPTKWLIALLAHLGLASGLKRVSPYKIIAARLRAKHQTAEDFFSKHPALGAVREKLKSHYEQLKNALHVWEQNRLEHRHSELRLAFKRSLQAWDSLYLKALRFDVA